MVNTRTITNSRGLASAFGALLPYTARAKARVRAGTARGKIAIIGPSTGRGLGGGTGGAGDVGLEQRSITARLAEILTARGVPAETNSFFGTGNTAAYNAWDSRLTVTSGWTAGSYARATIGGPTWSHTSANQNPLTYTTALNWDSVDLYHADNGARPDFIIAVAGSDVQTVSTTAGSTAIRKVARTTTRGTSTLALRKATSVSTEVAIVGADLWDSTTPKLSICNMAWCSSSVIDLADPEHILFPLSLPSWQFNAALQLFAPDLTIIVGYGTNEWYLNNTDISKQAGNTPAKFSAGLQAAITTAKLTGDVILCTFHPDNRSSTISGGSAQAEFNAIIKTLGETNNCPVIDFNSRVGTYTAGNALGYYFDSVHFTALGYAFEAEVLANAIAMA